MSNKTTTTILLILVILVVNELRFMIKVWHDYGASDSVNILTPTTRTVKSNNTSPKTPPTIYSCHKSDANGIGEARSILRSCFPEYRLDGSFVKGNPLTEFFQQPGATNEYDIFLLTYDAANHGECSDIINSWLLTHYNGYIIYITGESRYRSPIQGTKRDKLLAWGPITQSDKRPHDMLLTYLQMVWWHKFKMYLPPHSMVDPSRRPRGTKTYYMIYANSNCVGFREEAVGRLSAFGEVHCDGACQGAGGNRANLRRTNYGVGLSNWGDNVKLFAQYRFCVVMEHAEYHETYITEKILLAFGGGCIPIYYGPNLIFDIFNENAFVFYNISNPQLALDQVKALKDDPALYEQMMNEPILANGEATIQKYFSFSDKVGKGVLKRKMRARIGLM